MPKITITINVRPEDLEALQQMWLDFGNPAKMTRCALGLWQTVKVAAFTQFEAAVRSMVWEGRTVSIDNIPPNWSVFGCKSTSNHCCCLIFPEGVGENDVKNSTLRFLHGIDPELRGSIGFEIVELPKEVGQALFSRKPDGISWGVYDPKSGDIDKLEA